MTRKTEIEQALANLSAAAQEYANCVEKYDLNFESAPEYLQEADDYAYEIQTFVEDEIQNLEEVMKVNKKNGVVVQLHTFKEII